MRVKNKIGRLLISISIVLIGLLGVFSIFYKVKALNSFDITLTSNTEGYGSVYLDWSGYNYSNKNFKVYKSADGGATYETVGIDYTSVTRVNCLQIYPISTASNQLKNWMETNGYGKNIIKVDSVYIDDFNSNPNNYLKDVNGNYKYDVIFFGTWDSNNNKGLSVNASSATEAFIKSGRGCIFGHDTIAWTAINGGTEGYNTEFNRLSKYVNITHNNYWGNGINDISSNVKITKKGLFTTYPWYIGEIGTVLTIPQAHNVGQTANGSIWLKFTNMKRYQQE